MPKPTPEEVAKVRAILEASRQGGTDPIRELIREGCLLFDERRMLIISQALDQLALMIEEMTVKQIAELLERRMPTTPLDTKRYIIEIIRHTRNGLIEGDR